MRYLLIRYINIAYIYCLYIAYILPLSWGCWRKPSYTYPKGTDAHGGAEGERYCSQERRGDKILSICPVVALSENEPRVLQHSILNSRNNKWSKYGPK